MRFCPFCAQENTDDASECAHCGRRLPQVTARATTPAALPTSPVRPPAVRPLPRPRAVPTAAALATVARPVTTQTATLAPEARPPVHTVRGLPTVRPAAVEDGATRVDHS